MVPSAYTQYMVPASVEMSLGMKTLRMPLDTELISVENDGKIIDEEKSQ